MLLGPWSLSKGFPIFVNLLKHWYSWLKLRIVGTVCMMI